MASARNIHATALVIGTRGFLFVGASGEGKTSLALTCTAQAAARGIHAAFVGDDQVMIRSTGGHILAESITTISGCAEVRGSDIVNVPAIAAAVMDFAVLPVSGRAGERLAPEDEVYEIAEVGRLPLLRVPLEVLQPLAIIDLLAAGRQG